MATNGRMTRSLARQQSAYEDQARDIQKRINTCREAYHDAQEFLQDERLDANDSAQRKTQLIAQYRANIMQLNLHAANLDAAGKDYVELMRTYNIPHEDSEWASRMRCQHDQYFMQAPNLDFDLRELIFLYKNAIHRAQQPADSNAPSPELGRGLHLAQPAQQLRFPDGSEDGLADVSTDTHASTGANGNPPVRTPPPTNLVGERDLPEGSSERPAPTNLVGQDNLQETPQRQDPDASSTSTNTAPHQPRRVRIRETPEDIVPLRDLSLVDEDAGSDPEFFDAPSPTPVRATESRPAAAAERSSASTPLRSSRPPSMTTRQRPSYDSHSSSYGLFAYGDGLYTNATPMAWHHARTGNGQHHETFFYSSPRPSAHTDGDAVYRRSPLYLASLPAASAAPGAPAAHLAAGTAGEGIRSRRWSPLREPSPRRAEDPATRAVHRERLQHDLSDAAPPRRDRYDDFPVSHTAMPPHYGPTPAAWTSQPRAPTNLVGPSAATVHHRPPPPVIDHGADFGRENASKFYQNAIATYQRATSTNAPPFVLKELPIQKFSGDIRTYPVFRNRFIETVGGRSDLEPRHKFQHLLQCLDGEPLRLANGYMITDKNFYKILDRLEDRYGDKTTLVNLLAQDLVTMKPASPTTSDLRRFHDDALRLADEMEQAGEDVHNNILWRQTLVSKMPQSLRNKIYENLRKDPLSTPVHEILSCISDYLRVLEKGEVALSWNATADGHSGRADQPCRPDQRNTSNRAGGHVNGNSGRADQPCRPDQRSTANRAGAYANDAGATFTSNAKRSRRIKCAYCGRDHWASKCNIYFSIAQRYKRIKQLKYCRLCLRTGHWIATCPKKTFEACRQCHDGQHHRSLCKASFRNEPRQHASPRHSPVRASTRPGVQGLPKNEHGSSSEQEHRDTTSVSRSGAQERPTAKTVRFPSAHHSSGLGPSNSKKPRWKKSMGPRTDPQGRAGTTRPTTTSVAENVKQMDANACGGDGLLSEHSSHLTTDRRLTTAEAPWDDRTLGYGSGSTQGAPDTPRESAPWADEEASLPDTTGHCSDADTEPFSDECDDDPWFAPAPTNLVGQGQDYSGYAVSTTSPADQKAVLLECLKTTAINIDNGRSRPAIIFFDSGSNCSYISMQLAQDLRLPCLEKQLIRVNTFGTNATTTIRGFATNVLLRSPHGTTVALTITASDRIVPPVTTALVDDEDVAPLQKNGCVLISSREKPDLLIGQDLEYLFDYKRQPRLPSGFYIATTCLGPVAGGSGRVAGHQKIGSTTIAAVTTDLGPPKGRPPSKSELPTGTSTGQHRKQPRKRRLDFTDDDPLNLWTLEDDFVPAPAIPVGQDARETSSVPTNLVGSEGGDFTVVDASTHLCTLVADADADLIDDKPRELCATAATTTMSSKPSSRWPRTQWIQQRSRRKEPNPLDTTEPLPPTYTITNAAAAVVDATNLVAKPLKLPSNDNFPSKKEERNDHRPYSADARLLPKKPPFATAIGFDLAQCPTTLGRKPTPRGHHLVTMTTPRKTQLRCPPSNTDRRNLGIFEFHQRPHTKGRLGSAKQRLTALVPLHEPQKAADTLNITSTAHSERDDAHEDAAVLPSSPPAPPRADPLEDQNARTVDMADQPSPPSDARADTAARQRHVTLDRSCANEDFTVPGVISAATNLCRIEAPSTPRAAEAVTNLVAAEVSAPPPISTTTVEQNFRVQDAQAATDAETAQVLPATPDAATPSSTDAPPLLPPQPARQSLPPPPTSKPGSLRQQLTSPPSRTCSPRSWPFWPDSAFRLDRRTRKPSPTPDQRLDLVTPPITLYIARYHFNLL